jgi:hypothetical protein
MVDPAPNERLLLARLARAGVELQRPNGRCARSPSADRWLGRRPRATELVQSFERLRGELPAVSDPALAELAAELDRLFNHHGRMLHHALRPLAANRRSAAVIRQLERLNGIGAPAHMLRQLAAQLAPKGALIAQPKAKQRRSLRCLRTTI